MAGSYGHSIFSFLENFHTVLHSGCINVHPHQESRRVSFSLRPLQGLLFVDFLIMPILTGIFVVLINDIEQIFMCFESSVCFLWRNVCLDLLTIF